MAKTLVGWPVLSCLNITSPTTQSLCCEILFSSLVWKYFCISIYRDTRQLMVWCFGQAWFSRHLLEKGLTMVYKDCFQVPFWLLYKLQCQLQHLEKGFGSHSCGSASQREKYHCHSISCNFPLAGLSCILDPALGTGSGWVPCLGAVFES